MHTLPPEFDAISSSVNYVVERVRGYEWSGSCPECGGSVHQNGELPDRFRMWPASKATGGPLGWCRGCGYTWLPSSDKPSKEDVDYWRAEQIKIERARKEAAERAIALLQDERVWEQFYAQNNDWSREVFRGWGIVESMVEYLRLGLMNDYVVKGTEEYHSPAATIPLWNVGGVVQNIKLCVLNPKSGADRYRNLYHMGQSFLFVPLYDLPLKGTGVLVEGEKKAIVMEQTLDNIAFRVVGLSSKTPSAIILDQLKDLDPIYLWLDPDAFLREGKESAVERMCRLLGKERVRIVHSPAKCDDMIVQDGIDPMNYIRMARKA